MTLARVRGRALSGHRTHTVMMVIINNRVNRVSVHSAPYITSPPDDYEICIRILLAAFGHYFTMRLFYCTNSCGQFFVLMTLNLKITPAHFVKPAKSEVVDPELVIGVSTGRNHMESEPVFGYREESMKR